MPVVIGKIEESVTVVRKLARVPVITCINVLLKKRNFGGKVCAILENTQNERVVSAPWKVDRFVFSPLCETAFSALWDCDSF